MDVLQIDPVTFLIQVAGLGIWICAAALLYSVVEKMVGGPAAPEEHTKI